MRISNFQQYHHLLKVAEKAKHDPDLRAALGGDYFIEPDVVVVRHAESDAFIDGEMLVVDPTVANLTPLRAINDPPRRVDCSTQASRANGRFAVTAARTPVPKH